MCLSEKQEIKSWKFSGDRTRCHSPPPLSFFLRNDPQLSFFPQTLTWQHRRQAGAAVTLSPLLFLLRNDPPMSSFSTLAWQNRKEIEVAPSVDDRMNWFFAVWCALSQTNFSFSFEYCWPVTAWFDKLKAEGFYIAFYFEEWSGTNYKWQGNSFGLNKQMQNFCALKLHCKTSNRIICYLTYFQVLTHIGWLHFIFFPVIRTQWIVPNIEPNPN